VNQFWGLQVVKTFYVVIFISMFTFPSISHASGKWQVVENGGTRMAMAASDEGGRISLACNAGNPLIVLTAGGVELKNWQYEVGADTPLGMANYSVDGGAENEVVGNLVQAMIITLVPGLSTYQPFLRGLKSGSAITIKHVLSTDSWSIHHFSLRGSSAAINSVLSECE